MTQWTLTSEKSFLAEVKKARENGFAMDERESSQDSRCVGAPIRDGEGRIVGAVSLSGPISRMSNAVLEGTIIPALLRETSELSQSLGYSEERLKAREAKKMRRRKKE